MCLILLRFDLFQVTANTEAAETGAGVRISLSFVTFCKSHKYVDCVASHKKRRLLPAASSNAEAEGARLRAKLQVEKLEGARLRWQIAMLVNVREPHVRRLLREASGACASRWDSMFRET